ncbi:MAG TPA: lipopolysaccharide biosynthesis protein [Verrucomicrobiae bacterium]|nr:lipopolysaccharide biosynthesis protein [Verrucomicrobiae bacterium]
MGATSPDSGYASTKHSKLFDGNARLGLKRRSVRGAVVTMAAQGVRFCLQTGSVMVLARLLSPSDYGLQGMVLALIGVLSMFKDAGLSGATVQRDTITHDQVSTLFWLNGAMGVLLSLSAILMAPLMASFYREPRLCWITIASGSAFLFWGMGVQHRALLQRNMRFGVLATIDLVSLAGSSAAAIILAFAGWGYWALVAAAISEPVLNTIGVWISVPWRPGMPKRGTGVRSLLRFGGTMTANGLVVYLGYNAEKILLGRFWGASALGLYGRAYQLVNLPTSQLHSAIFAVAFPALSQLQKDPVRFRASFLKAYSIILSMTVPITVCFTLFADEIILTVLGPKWSAVVPIFRFLAPTVLTFGMINPTSLLLIPSGLVGRSLRMALLISPTVILGILAGLRFGPRGVAVGYSAALTVLVWPLLVWARAGTGVATRDIVTALRAPLISGLVALAVGLCAELMLPRSFAPVIRLAVGTPLVLGSYAVVLLFGLKQIDVFKDVAAQILPRRVSAALAPDTTPA